jgi:oligoendopeptidase F
MDKLSRSDTDEYGALPEWNLDDLYPGMESAEFKRDLSGTADTALNFEQRYMGSLAGLVDDPDKLGEAIAEFEKLNEIMGRIMSYAGLIHAGDTIDPVRAKFYGDAHEKITLASSHLLFFALEINRIDDKVLDGAIASSAALRHYQPWLEDLRKDRPYQLEDRIEQLFHDKSVTSYSAWNRLFDETMAQLRFTVGGKKLAVEPALNLLQEPDRETRREAAEEIAGVLEGNGRLFTLITNTLAKDKQISDQWRGFDDVAASRHLANRVEPQVVDALVEAVCGSFPATSHRYYKLKARWLGLETLEYWDRNAPLPFAPQRRFRWEEARDTVLSAYRDFAPEMADIAGRFFERSWIDAPVREGKQAGAFSHPTVPSVHPYVLLNYQGRPRDVMTLAHELGHGVHQVLAAGQGALMSQTPLTLAETASVFGEMLTFRSMLDNCADTTERRAMLAQKIEDMINTVVRQIAFYLFERKVHIERSQGELTQEKIGEFWMEASRESLGPAFDLADSYHSYWSYIPHFIHSPFYVYAYAFGDCLVNSLFQVYQASESGFQRRYFDMLRAGGSKHYDQLLSPFGLDAGDPSFWDRGLAVIKGLIDELEGME